MNKLNLLIVEDDKDFRESYNKQIGLFNIDQEDVVVVPLFADDADKAKSLLPVSQIDAAIVDLKLGATDVDYRGNELIEIIKSNLRFPAFIVTANPEKIEEEKGNQNDLFRVIVKGSSEANFTTILNVLKGIHLTGITKILGKAGQIEKYLNLIFWNHLSSVINTWAADTKRSPDQKEKALLRHTLAHIQEHLDLTEGGEFEHYTPSEFYITPPIKPTLFTGDVIECRRKKHIVLTPACDFGNKKADNILLVSIRPWEELDTDFDKRPLSKKKEDKLKELMGNKVPRYHFAPKTSSAGAGFIDFQSKRTVDLDKINFLLASHRAKRVSTISMPFLKDIVSRYSNYYSRQGSPDFLLEEVYNSLL